MLRPFPDRTGLYVLDQYEFLLVQNIGRTSDDEIDFVGSGRLMAMDLLPSSNDQTQMETSTETRCPPQ